MKKFAVTNIDIDYDEIQEEWRCLSKRQIKRAVYNFVYGYLRNQAGILGYLLPSSSRS